MLYYNLFALWADWSRMDELKKMTSPQECGAICKFGASHQLQSCDTSPSHLVGKYHIFSHHQTKKGIFFIISNKYLLKGCETISPKQDIYPLVMSHISRKSQLFIGQSLFFIGASSFFIGKSSFFIGQSLFFIGKRHISSISMAQNFPLFCRPRR